MSQPWFAFADFHMRYVAITKSGRHIDISRGSEVPFECHLEGVVFIKMCSSRSQEIAISWVEWYPL